MFPSTRGKYCWKRRKCMLSATNSTGNIYSNQRLLPHAPGNGSFLIGVLSNQRKTSSTTCTLFSVSKRCPVPNINITAKENQKERKLLQNPGLQCPQRLWEQFCLPVVLWEQRCVLKPSHPDSFTRQKVYHLYFSRLSFPQSQASPAHIQMGEVYSQRRTTVAMRRTLLKGLPSISLQNLTFLQQTRS